MRVGSLFSGGGLGDFGFLMAGCEIVFQVEIDDYCQKLLALRYPDAKRFRDIRSVKGADLPECDIITGGFPCQDVSVAGLRAGIGGAKSGLWKEYLRIICEVRPRYVVVENVTGLLSDGMGVVLGDLAAVGYDSEYDCIPASAFNAPHRRDRVWICAYPQRSRLQGRVCKSFSKSEKRQGWYEQFERLLCDEREMAVPTGKSGGVSDGASNRVHRLKLLGNGQVPHCTKWIAEQIMKFECSVNKYLSEVGK